MIKKVNEGGGGGGVRDLLIGLIFSNTDFLLIFIFA